MLRGWVGLGWAEKEGHGERIWKMEIKRHVG